MQYNSGATKLIIMLIKLKDEFWKWLKSNSQVFLFFFFFPLLEKLYEMILSVYYKDKNINSLSWEFWKNPNRWDARFWKCIIWCLNFQIVLFPKFVIQLHFTEIRFSSFLYYICSIYICSMLLHEQNLNTKKHWKA